MIRSRTFTWTDPALVRETRHSMSGLEFLQRVAAGELPPAPMARLMDIRITELVRGRVVFEGTPQEFHYNPLGTIHGGMAATLLDSALGCCVNTCLEAGDLYTTLELKINYLRPLTLETGPVRAIASIIHLGRTTALAEGRVLDAADAIYAYASSTYLIRRVSPAATA